MRKFFRATYSVAVIALFVAAVVLGFTQTKLFRSYLRTKLVQMVTNDLHGELALSSLEGNLFTGFQVENVVLRRDGEPVLTVERLEVKYDPLGLLTKSVSVSRLVLTNPAIHLTRSAVGEWNFDRFLRSSSRDTTSSSWTINLKQIQIRGGALEIVDSLGLAQRTVDSSIEIVPGKFNYSNIALDSLNLEGSLTVHPGEIGLSLKSFACRSPLPHFQLKNLSGDFVLARKSASVRKMRVETGRSKLQLDARFDSIDITRIDSLAQLQSVPISVRLNIDRLDFGELKQCVGTPVKFLEREIAGQIDLEGHFGLIDVRNVTIHAGSSVVRIAGTVANLHKPKDLELDLACIKNRIDPIDLRHLMPTDSIPDLSALGFVDYELRFKGKPTSFNAKLSCTSHVGKVDVDGNIDIRDGTMSYDGTIKTARFNVAPLAGDSSVASSLKTSITVQGKGTRLADMTAVVRAEIDSSEFSGLPVGRSVAVMDIADRAIRPRISLRIGSARIDLGGTLQIRAQDIIEYDLSGRINSLNLSDITKKQEHNSDVSFDLQAKGRMKTFAALSGDISLNVFRSSFDTVTFDEGSARILLNTLDQEPRTLNVTSDIGDLDVQGHFTPATLLSAIAHGADYLGDAARYRVNSMDSLRTQNLTSRSFKEFRTTVTPGRDSTEYTVKLNIKDCFLAGVLLGRELNGRLTANGRVKEASKGVEWNGTIDVPEFSYSDRRLKFSLDGATLSYGASGLSTPDLLHSMRLFAGVRAAHFDIQGLHTTNVAVSVNVKGDSSRFTMEGVIDSLVTVRARGGGAFAHQLLMLEVGDLQAGISSSEFRNTAPVDLRVGRDGLQIGTLKMQHDGEEVWASGYFDPTGVSDVSFSVKNLIADNIPKMFRRAVNRESLPAMNGVVNAVGTFKGSFEEPRFTAELNATGV
ncbi:MAG: AsmA family protein, partial [Ignavibacteriales bacterium]|nr:AsmA family protein [Ignavibacteriales bacterium]